MSPNFVKIGANTEFQPIVVKLDRISDIIEKVTKSFDRIFSLVERRESSDRPKEIPELKE
ncbi:MAG: hypothetical protein KAW56_00410 [Candidatus Marinimicrobia bacterium]|nr:hypothetical protein [Candidatus Neomarinimicrobiota bacterium]